jgi:anti-sigma factor RsiW
MNRCEEIRSQVSFYLDEELSGGDRASFETHLLNCGICRDVIENERQFLETVRGLRPLHCATPELRARVQQLLAEVPPAHAASPQLRNRIHRYFSQLNSNGAGLLTRRGVVAVTTILALALAIGVWRMVAIKSNADRHRPSEFALMAVDTHQRHLRNQLPLEISSVQPEQISAWFTGKVPFGVKLPNYQESSGQDKLYNLEGARLVGYRKDYAAYVAYQMDARPISLVMTSDSVAQPSGGEEIISSGITFHYDSIDGLKVITWSDRGLTYALVSDLEERGQQSCIVCHEGTKDKDFIESLKPH